jgi:hypothetical protein
MHARATHYPIPLRQTYQQASSKDNRYADAEIAYAHGSQVLELRGNRSLRTHVMPRAKNEETHIVMRPEGLPAHASGSCTGLHEDMESFYALYGTGVTGPHESLTSRIYLSVFL